MAVSFASDAPPRVFVKGTGDHSWSEPAVPFEVRSKTYVTDKVKVDSDASLMTLVDADIVLVTGSKNSLKIDHFSKRPDSYAYYLREVCKDQRRMLVVVFQVHPRYLVLTYVETDRPANERIEAGKLLDRFFGTEWSDDDRGHRLKLIPRIENFSVPGVNLNRPTIIANKLSCQFFRSDNLVGSRWTLRDDVLTAS